MMALELQLLRWLLLEMLMQSVIFQGMVTMAHLLICTQIRTILVVTLMCLPEFNRFTMAVSLITSTMASFAQ